MVFTTLLVSANSTATSIPERTTEVAVLKALGFTGSRVLSLFVSQAVRLSVAGGMMGACLGELLAYGFGRVAQLTFPP